MFKFYTVTTETRPEEQGDEAEAACLVQTAAGAPVMPEEACFALRRQLLANPTYALPTRARIDLVGEVMQKPSGMVEHQWHMPDLVKECVYALEQRMLHGATVHENQQLVPSSTVNAGPKHDAETSLLDEDGLLRLFPVAVKAFLERPWRFYPHTAPGYTKTVCAIPSKRDTDVDSNESLFCLEIWV